MTARAESTDGPGAAWLAALERLASSHVDVGIQGADGGDAGEHRPEGEPNAEIMAAHEFGAGVPPRPVLIPASLAAHDDLAHATAEAVGAAVVGGPEAASAVLGEILLLAMREQMVSQGLVATGQLLAALRWAHGRQS